MNGLSYMLLGIAIMLLGHNIYIPYVFDVVGFVVVIYGFVKVKQQKELYSQKMIAIVRMNRNSSIVDIQKITYDKERNKYTICDNTIYYYDISPKCIIKILSDDSFHNLTRITLDDWVEKYQNRIYCIGINDGKIVYLEEVDESVVKDNIWEEIK